MLWNCLIEAVLKSNHNLCFEQNLETIMYTPGNPSFNKLKRCLGGLNYMMVLARCMLNQVNSFLAHLSRRLIGELIVYPWSGVRRRSSASVVVHMLNHLLLRNCLVNQSQILCGASLGRGNEILFAASGSHDQDGRQAHIW